MIRQQGFGQERQPWAGETEGKSMLCEVILWAAFIQGFVSCIAFTSCLQGWDAVPSEPWEASGCIILLILFFEGSGLRSGRIKMNSSGRVGYSDIHQLALLLRFLAKRTVLQQ